MKSEALQTLRLAFPIIIGEIAQLLLHIIDTAMVGAVSYVHLAAASLVLNVINIPFVLGIGATIAVSQFVSMARGRGDEPAVAHYLYNGFMQCAAVAVGLSMTLFFGRGLLHHLGQDPEVVRLAVPFFELMTLSIIPAILFLCLKHFADGLEHARIPMILSLGALPLNIGLNWLLIYGNWGFPRLELVGSGWATLITRCTILVALIAVLFTHRYFRPYTRTLRHEWRVRRRTWNDLLRIAVPSSLQIGLEASAFAVTGILIGTIGAVAQAAHQIALSCVSFTFMIALGLAQAGSIRASNAYGGDDWPKIRTIGRSTGLMALSYGLFCAVAVAALHHVLPGVFNDNAAVIELAGTLLVLAALFQVSDATQVCAAALLRGVKDTRLPTLFVAIAYWVIGLPVGYFFATSAGLGASGMWLGLITGLTLASVLLWLRFRRVTARAKVVVEEALEI